MDYNKNEILKVKKIRKILLVKINDELKDILKYKSNIKINSKTIPEINKTYSLSEFQLVEKPMLYSHYVKTEEAILPSKSKDGFNRKISKSMNKIKIRPKNKSRINIKKVEGNSFEEESFSPLNSYFPKKIELGRRKMPQNKSKNKGSIPNILPKGIKLEKDNVNKPPIVSYSTRMNKRDLHLEKLVERLTFIKDNQINEDIIKESIRKLRKICYQLKKKKKKIKKVVNYSFRRKTMDRERARKRNAIRVGVLKNSDSLIKNFYYMNSSKKNNDNLGNFNNSIKNKNLFKLSEKSVSPLKPEEKVKKTVFSLVKKEKKKEKKSNKNSIKTTVNISGTESNEIPDVFQISRKGIPFFHNTTVNIYENDIIDKENKEKQKKIKKSLPKELIFQQRKKSKMLQEKDLLMFQQSEQKEPNNNASKFLNINYVYHRNNNKKKRTKVENLRMQSNKKLLKLELKNVENNDFNPTIIKLNKVNNGEIKKTIKKRKIKDKEKKINRYSYLSNNTDTQYRTHNTTIQKSMIKK